MLNNIITTAFFFNLQMVHLRAFFFFYLIFKLKVILEKLTVKK